MGLQRAKRRRVADENVTQQALDPELVGTSAAGRNQAVADPPAALRRPAEQADSYR